jgi:hypothetical protein
MQYHAIQIYCVKTKMTMRGACHEKPEQVKAMRNVIAMDDKYKIDAILRLG